MTGHIHLGSHRKVSVLIVKKGECDLMCMGIIRLIEVLCQNGGTERKINVCVIVYLTR